MKACSKYKELIYLDVLGEIPPRDKEKLQAHIGQCDLCKREKERMEVVLDRVQGRLGQVSLSSFEANVMRQKIISKLNPEQRRFSLKAIVGGRIRILLPVAAAACLFLVSLVGIKQWRHGNFFNSSRNSDTKVEAQAQVEEKEIIENLDLLEQMDTLRALVKVVDNKDVI